MSRDEAEVRALLKAHGTQVKLTKRGALWRLGDELVVLPNIMRDSRSWRNLRAVVRRAAVAQGLRLPCS